MIGIHVMAGVLCCGVMTFAVMMGLEPVPGALGAIISWIVYSLTIKWAESKVGDLNDENVRVETKVVEASADRRMRKLLDAVCKLLDVKEDSQIRPAIQKLLSAKPAAATRDPELEQALNSAKQRESSLSQQLADWQSKYAQLERNFNKLESSQAQQLSRANSDAAELENAKMRSEAGRSWALNQIELLQPQVETLTRDLEQSEQLRKQTAQELEALELKIADVSKEHESCISRLDESKQELLAQAQKLEEASKLESDLRAEIEVERNRVVTARQEFETELAAVNLQLKTLAESIETEKASAEQVQLDYQSSLDQLRQKVTEAELDASKARVELAKLEVDKLRAQQAWSFFESRIDLVDRLMKEIDEFDAFLNILDPDTEPSQWVE